MTIRLIAAGAVLVSAAVHLYLWLNGVREQGTVGQLFVVNVVAGVVIAVMLVAWRSWVPPFLAAGFGASTLGAFVISSTVGLFGIHTTWEGFYVWAAAVSEGVAIVAGPAALAGARSAAQLQHR
jgi:hypothetical protein